MIRREKMMQGIRRLVSALTDLWLDRTVCDWILSSGLAWIAIHFRWSQFVHLRDAATLYNTLAAVGIAFVSIGTMAITLLVTVTPTATLREALAAAGRDLINTMFRCLRALILATLSYPAMFLLDGSDWHIVRVSVFAVATGVMLLSGARLLWLLRLTLRLLV